jgi:hypothetical protein
VSSAIRNCTVPVGTVQFLVDGTVIGSAAAVDQNGSAVPLTTTVPAVGAFSHTTDTVTLTVNGDTAAPTPVVVTDTRDTFPGWAVSGEAAGFTGSGTASGASIPVASWAGCRPVPQSSNQAVNWLDRDTGHQTVRVLHEPARPPCCTAWTRTAPRHAGIRVSRLGRDTFRPMNAGTWPNIRTTSGMTA